MIGVPKLKTIRFRIQGLTMNQMLFNEGLRPVFQDQTMAETKWTAVAQSSIIKERTADSGDERTFSLVFQHEFQGSARINWCSFALIEPYTYTNCMYKMIQIE